MKTAYAILIFLLLFSGKLAFSQAGAGDKAGGARNQAYVDSIKNSNYIWTFPAWGKKISKRGIDIPYPVGIMTNIYVGSQDVNISDLQVGFNDGPLIPLDFIKFGKVTANIQTVTVRPDVWVLPFMDLYGIVGINRAQTSVEVVSPIKFNTQANFKGYTYGFGTTFAGGYHGFITIIDFNHTWSFLDKIDDAVQATMVTPRLGYNFHFDNPIKTVAFWVGTTGFFVNRTTQGTINLSDLQSTSVSDADLTGIINGTSDWLDNLTPAQKLVLKQIAEKIRDKIEGGSGDATISYSLKKRPTHTWSMLVGGQYQFSHRWQVRTEVGFLGGRTSLLLSGNYRFRW